MPSARIDRPNLDASDSRTLKRARLLSHRDCSRISPTAAVDDRTGLPAALAASAIACKVPKFLRSLYAILQTEDPHIISWVQNKDLTPNRVTAFHILEMERFEREILPKYFKHQKFASFQRQLNNFGFRKWTKTQSSGVCTFSHNCFPPDLSAAMPCNMSVRDQWRQKSSQVQPSIAAGGSIDSPLMKRGFVSSSGIATAKAQHLQVDSSSVSRGRPVHVQVPGRDIVDTPSPFGEMYRSPNSTASVDSSAFRHHLSHQPPLKKLARPHVVVKQETSDLLDGLEAFCDDSFKQVVLPPLQPHFLQAATPRSSLLSVSLTSPFSIPSDFGTAQAPSGCRFPLSQVVNNPSSSSILSVDARCGGTGFKSFDMKQVNEAPMGSIRSNTNTGAGDEAAVQGAFLEPWMWDAQPACSSFELAPVPLEFECRGPDLDCKLEPEWQEISGANAYQVMNGLSADLSTTGMLDTELRHQQDRGESLNSEDCGLETLLFAE